MFELYEESGAQREYDKHTEWECIVDAVYTFGGDDDDCDGGNKRRKTATTQPTTTSTPTSINCIFSRVYLYDMDFCVASAEFEEPKITKQSRRQMALRKKLKNLFFSLAPDDEVSLPEQKFGPLSDVHFRLYPSNHTTNIFYPLNVASSSSTENAENDDDAGAEDDNSKVSPSPPSKSSSASDAREKVDFAFNPIRDAALVAKNANKHFVKDKDKVMNKYWYQRKRFFSRLSDGILMDREGWFSVTPERMARYVADRVVLVRDCTVLDAFTGVGGNAIQFALRGAYVIAIDIDPVKLRCARQNARIYGVQNRISFICGSFFHVAASMFGARAAKLKQNTGGDGGGQMAAAVTTTVIRYPHGIDAVFLSPPWGGPAYLKMDRPFDLVTDMELNGIDIFRVAQQISPNIAYFLPKNTRTDQLIALAGGPDGYLEIEQTSLNEKIKALHAYFGLLVVR